MPEHEQVAPATILVGDVRQRLLELPQGSIQTCVTSPPYWGLRDYGTASWEGGDPACEHSISAYPDTLRGDNNVRPTAAHRGKDVSKCHTCGAKRIDSQLGLEPTPQDYVENLCQVFDQVWRVLKDDGTVWLNLGDTYSAHKDCKSIGQTLAKGTNRENAHVIAKGVSVSRNSKMLKEVGLKNKDLIGIPWRVAFALQERGWYLRQDIIWSKPNPMPESVKDRCTKSHEYLFLLSKSARYLFNSDRIKEDAVTNNDGHRFGGNKYTETKDDLFRTKGSIYQSDGKRNKRSVWVVNTKPFKGAHFAVMPEALVEPCVLAGSNPNDLVLDPFAGSGTVGVVSLRHNRRFVGCELNPEYAAIAHNRIGPLLSEVK